MTRTLRACPNCVLIIVVQLYDLSIAVPAVVLGTYPLMGNVWAAKFSCQWKSIIIIFQNLIMRIALDVTSGTIYLIRTPCIASSSSLSRLLFSALDLKAG